MKERIIKFLIVGGSCTTLNYWIFFILLNQFGVHYILSSAIGYLVGLAAGYFINKFWTFQVDKSSKETFVVKYVLVNLVSLATNSMVLKILVEYLSFNVLIANVFAIGVSTVMNFIGTNFLVFKDAAGQRASDI